MSKGTGRQAAPLAADWLVGGGEMGALIRARNWADTPLGPVERWPQSLRSAVSILLPSKAQIALFWGEDLVTLYNDAYRPVFGAKHPAALGKPIREAWGELWLHGLKALFDGVLTTGEAFWGQDLPFFMERHGYVEETYFDVSYDPVRDESGRVAGVFCIVAEKTGRVVGERRLRALRDLRGIAQPAASVAEVYRAAAGALADYPEDIAFAQLYSAAGGSQPRLAGACRLEGALDWPLSGELHIVGAETLAQIGELRAGPYPEPIREVSVVPIALPGELPQGWLVAGINPRRKFDDGYGDFLRLAAANIASAVAGVRALEAERHRAEALAELDRAKTAFFGNVSHEFRTPLTLMLGPLEDVLAKDLAAETRARLEVVERNGQRLLKLVNTLLDFARIEAGRAQAAYQPLDLALLTADLASNFRSACERAGLRLAVDCPALAEPAYVDPQMWEKIVLNLLSNAFKFTLQGEIAVSLRMNDQFELEVRDTGAGIPAEALPRMFERFHRVEDTHGRSHEGSGIGLALVNELVKLHGGSIAVESTLGQGTTFTVRIPKGRAHLPAERVKAPRESPAAGGSRAHAYVAEALGWLPGSAQPVESKKRGPRVLLADDNADLREYARRLLAEHYEVQAVADGAAALEAARARPPQLVISDVMMPRLDGFGLLRELRADPALCAIPVILLSARAGEEARVEGLGKGADDYLVKPFSSRELLVRVGTLIQSGLAREALRDADARKDEFLATLAHELRNPLAPLRSSLDALKLTGAGGAASAPALEIMDRQLSHLVRLVDDLMEVSRITRGNVELRKERVRLDVALRNAVEAAEPIIRAGRHRVQMSMPPEAIWLEADPVRLGQIFGNLLNNAAKYSDDGGHITIDARRDGGDAVVAISDTGEGIEAEQLPQLFRIFARGNRSAERNQTGLGIGLALVRRLAELHGGRVDAASAGRGKGSRFTVRLPAAMAQPAAPASGRREHPTVPPITILLVDDNRDAADSMGMLLKQVGADVRVARDGAEALAAFEAHQPRLVLLDIGMPGMDGYEVARRLRALPHGASASLVALTGWGQDEDRRRTREAGFDHHLVKPADFGTLQSLIASIQGGAH